MFRQLVKFEDRLSLAWRILTGRTVINGETIECSKNHFDANTNVLVPMAEHKNLKAAALALEIASGVILGLSTKENQLYPNYTNVVAKATQQMRK